MQRIVRSIGILGMMAVIGLGQAACSARNTEAGASVDRPTATPSPTATATPTPTPTPTPKVVRRTVTDDQPVPFTVKTVRDSSAEKGTRAVRTRGVDGVRTLTYRVTWIDGERTDRRLISTEVTKRPVAEVVAIGTRPSGPRCDPNYSGGCVPIASDVDCAGGSGDGPGYVQGPVRVVGSDIYDLDSDSDGTGCDVS